MPSIIACLKPSVPSAVVLAQKGGYLILGRQRHAGRCSLSHVLSAVAVSHAGPSLEKGMDLSGIRRLAQWDALDAALAEALLSDVMTNLPK